MATDAEIAAAALSTSAIQKALKNPQTPQDEAALRSELAKR